MKITFVLPYAGLSGGIKVAAIYAERLSRLGHDVTVVSVPDAPLTLRQKIRILLNEKKWPSQEHDHSHFDYITVKHKIIERYRPIINEDVPDGDVVIATWWKTAEWIKNFSSTKGKKFYFVQGHETLEGQPIERVKDTYQLPFQKITISKWLVDVMANEYGDRNVFLVPNSVDQKYFYASPRCKQRIPTVGFMYSTIYCKGCDIIIQALNMVLKKVPDLKIVVFGAIKPASYLPLPSGTDYSFQPQQDQIREIYCKCDFWLFGSRMEGFGLPLLEAMACRTPVIATKSGAAPELVSQGGGVFVEKCLAETMAETIMHCLEMSEKRWKEMSTLAQNTVTQYSWDDATDLFEKALLKAI